MNVAQLAEDSINRFGEYVILIFEGQRFTNVEMDRVARKLGNGLRKIGVRRGDRVIIQMPNCTEALQSFQAVWKIGAVAVPISFLMGDEETAYIYQDSGALTVISSTDFMGKIEMARSKAPEVKNIILIDKEAPNTFYYPRLVEEGSEELETAETDDDELAALIYTAGTTGRPKGVMLSHYALYYNAKMQHETLDLEPGRTIVSSLPLCHSYGIATMNSNFLFGGTIALMRWFQLEEFFGLVEKYKASLSTAVPMMYIFMLLSPEADKYDLSSMKYWVSGAAPLALETARAFREKFGGTIYEGWGLTEAGANNAVNPFTGPVKVGSIGKPMKGTEIKIFDDNDNELPVGQAGEIVVRGPMLMKGYWNMPEETAEALRGGWLRTGDVGYKDEDGYFFITERKKDLIIKAGENIFPREIEEVLMTHPKVAEVAVVGIKDDIYGEDIKAFAVLKPGEQATEEEMIDHCRQRLTRFKTPKSVQFIDAMPKNIVGKILKKELRKLG